MRVPVKFDILDFSNCPLAAEAGNDKSTRADGSSQVTRVTRSAVPGTRGSGPCTSLRNSVNVHVLERTRLFILDPLPR